MTGTGVKQLPDIHCLCRPLWQATSDQYIRTSTGFTVYYKIKVVQGSHRLEKYLNLEEFLEKSLKFKSALNSTGKALKGLEKSLNYFIFCIT